MGLSSSTSTLRDREKPHYGRSRSLIVVGICTSGNCTSSPAVAERLRDAPCLSVVSFNSTMRGAQSFVISYFDFRFTTAYK